MHREEVRQKILRGAFTAEELSYLKQQDEFRQAAAAMRSITDFQRVCELGNKLLLDREHGLTPNSEP
jgi:hypothetical protein